MTEALELQQTNMEIIGDNISDDFIDYELIDKLCSKNLLSLNSARPKSFHKGDYVWDMESLRIILIDTGIDPTLVEEIIMPNPGISYRDLEAVLVEDPRLLITSMTLLANNYYNIIADGDSTYMEGKELEDIYYNRIDFLFTDEEEILFFIGRTLLKELNANIKNSYIENLIKDLDGIICRFNEGLIGSIVKKYRYFAEEKILYQAGEDGMLRAIEKFDIRRGNKFGTYAIPWIDRMIIRFNKNNHNEIRLPVYMRDAVSKCKIVQEILIQKKIAPTFDNIINYCQENDIVLPDNLDNLKSAINASQIRSLDKEFESSSDSGESNLYSYTQNDEVPIEQQILDREKSDMIDKLFMSAGLTEREISILKLRFGIIPNNRITDQTFHSYKEIADILGLSGERIRQIEIEALRKVKPVAYSSVFAEFFNM